MKYIYIHIWLWTERMVMTESYVEQNDVKFLMEKHLMIFNRIQDRTKPLFGKITFRCPVLTSQTSTAPEEHPTAT